MKIRFKEYQNKVLDTKTRYGWYEIERNEFVECANFTHSYKSFREFYKRIKNMHDFVCYLPSINAFMFVGSTSYGIESYTLATIREEK